MVRLKFKQVNAIKQSDIQFRQTPEKPGSLGRRDQEFRGRP